MVAIVRGRNGFEGTQERRLTGRSPVGSVWTAASVFQLLFQSRAGDVRRAGKIHDLAEVLEEIKLSFPIVTHDEDVDVVVDDILAFLFPRILEQDFVDVLECADDLRPLPIGNGTTFVFFDPVEAVA